MLLNIKLLMTIAMLFYISAFAVGRNRWIAGHIILALCGFVFDLYATYLMETLGAGFGLAFSFYPPILKFHTIVSIIAIAAFLLQMFLGIYRKKTWHVLSAKFIFFPMWTISYLSGMYLIW